MRVNGKVTVNGIAASATSLAREISQHKRRISLIDSYQGIVWQGATSSETRDQSTSASKLALMRSEEEHHCMVCASAVRTSRLTAPPKESQNFKGGRRETGAKQKQMQETHIFELSTDKSTSLQQVVIASSSLKSHPPTPRGNGQRDSRVSHESGPGN